MKKILFIICVFLFVITGCTKSDAVRFKKEYEALNNKKTSIGGEYINLNINKNNVIKYSDINDIIDIINNGTGVIYFGYPECMKCRSAVDVLLDIDNAYLDTIYYLNVNNIRDRYVINDDSNITLEVEGDKDYKQLLEVLDSILQEYTLIDTSGNEVAVGEKRLYVPLVIFVKNGKIVDSHYNTVNTHIDGNLNKEEKKELSDIYKKGIDSIYNSNYCSKESEC